MSDHDHDPATGTRYQKAVGSLVEDSQRSKRERDVERAFGGENIRTVLRRLHDEEDGNRSAMRRRINSRLEEFTEGEDSGIGRGTLYNWLSTYEDDVT